MRKTITTLAALIMVTTTVFFVGCGKLPSDPSGSSVTPEGDSVVIIPGDGSNKETYTVTYYGIIDGEVVEIPKECYKKDGNYPTSYRAGEQIYISPLEEIAYIGEHEDREFHGWYADAACTTLYSEMSEEEAWYFFEEGTYIKEVAGGVTFKAKADITLYAKLTVAYWLGPY